jgi:hypothetical protein
MFLGVPGGVVGVGHLGDDHPWTLYNDPCGRRRLAAIDVAHKLVFVKIGEELNLPHEMIFVHRMYADHGGDGRYGG